MLVAQKIDSAFTRRRIMWKAVNRIRSSFAKQITRLWRRKLEDFLEGDFLAVQDAMIATFVEVGTPFAQSQFNRLVNQKQLGDIENEVDRLMANYARTEMGDITRSIQDTTAKLADDISQQGLSLTDEQKAINDMLDSRANLNSQNQIVTASNVGQNFGAELAFAAAVATVEAPRLVKTWIATIDDRVRDGHDNADGQTVESKEVFIVTGEALQFPKDPSGTAGNTINCRCVVQYQKIKNN